jgi:hypothetical protein
VQRLTPEQPQKKPRAFITVNMPRDDYARLQAIAKREGAPIHKIVTGLLKYYEETEGEYEDD